MRRGVYSAATTQGVRFDRSSGVYRSCSALQEGSDQVVAPSGLQDGERWRAARDCQANEVNRGVEAAGRGSGGYHSGCLLDLRAAHRGARDRREHSSGDFRSARQDPASRTGLTRWRNLRAELSTRRPYRRQRLRALVWTDVLARHGLDCAEDGGRACAAKPEICRGKAGRYLGKDWPICPMRSALSDPYVQAIAHLESASRLSPLTDWPDSYAHWVPAMWGTLRHLMADRQAHAMEQAKGGSDGG